VIKGATIHGHYTEAIRDASSLPELYGYLRKKMIGAEKHFIQLIGHGSRAPREIISTQTTTA
jgi:hypothetical protein